MVVIGFGYNKYILKTMFITHEGCYEFYVMQFVIPKSYHHHVIITLTSMFALNPNT